VTHPFHPLLGREYDLIQYRHFWGKDRLAYLDEAGEAHSLPTRALPGRRSHSAGDACSRAGSMRGGRQVLLRRPIGGSGGQGDYAASVSWILPLVLAVAQGVKSCNLPVDWIHEARGSLIGTSSDKQDLR